MKPPIRYAVWAVCLLMAASSVQVVRAEDLRGQVDQTIATLKATDPTIQRFFDTSVGYAVFPTISKGGLIVGAARGAGLVFEGGRIVGRSTMTQGSIGGQIGGMTYSQVIFFQTPAALAAFKSGTFTMSASANAVAATQGAGAVTQYQNGFAVFTMLKGGAMAQATVAGQRFSFEPFYQ